MTIDFVFMFIYALLEKQGLSMLQTWSIGCLHNSSVIRCEDYEVPLLVINLLISKCCLA